MRSPTPLLYVFGHYKSAERRWLVKKPRLTVFRVDKTQENKSSVMKRTRGSAVVSLRTLCRVQEVTVDPQRSAAVLQGRLNATVLALPS